MTPKEYAEKQWPGYPTYQKIAETAFEAGFMQNFDGKLIAELKAEIKELKEYKEILFDPERCAEWLSGS